jgi:hypothetical protein
MRFEVCDVCRSRGPVLSLVLSLVLSSALLV